MYQICDETAYKKVNDSPYKFAFLTPFTWQPSGGNAPFLAVPPTLLTLFIPYDLDYVAFVTFDSDEALHPIRFH